MSETLTNTQIIIKDDNGQIHTSKSLCQQDETRLNNMVKLMNLILQTPNSADFINTLATKAYADDAVPTNMMTTDTTQSISGVKTFTNNIVGNVTGNADTATKATQDSDGNTIKTTYAKLNSPAFTGTPTVPTASTNTNNTQIATTAFVKAQGYLTSHQSLDSCVKTSGNQTIAGVKTFSSSPKAPTPDKTTNDTTLATTAYVKSQGYLTSHQSLDSCVKISGDQTIAGVKTFNSDIVFGATGLRIRRNDTDKYLIFEAGNSSDTSSSITISGTTRPNSEGVISFVARDSNNNYSTVYLKPDGSIVWNGNSLKSLMSNYSMPGSAYSSLTVGASGDSYTAPDDGYVCMVANNQNGGEEALLELKNTTNKLESRCLTSSGGYELSVLLPVCKGQSYRITYSNVYNLALYYVRTVGA